MICYVFTGDAVFSQLPQLYLITTLYGNGFDYCLDSGDIKDQQDNAMFCHLIIKVILFKT